MPHSATVIARGSTMGGGGGASDHASASSGGPGQGLDSAGGAAGGGGESVSDTVCITLERRRFVQLLGPCEEVFAGHIQSYHTR